MLIGYVQKKTFLKFVYAFEESLCRIYRTQCYCNELKLEGMTRRKQTSCKKRMGKTSIEPRVGKVTNRNKRALSALRGLFFQKRIIFTKEQTLENKTTKKEKRLVFFFFLLLQYTRPLERSRSTREKEDKTQCLHSEWLISRI